MLASCPWTVWDRMGCVSPLTICTTRESTRGSTSTSLGGTKYLSCESMFVRCDVLACHETRNLDGLVTSNQQQQHSDEDREERRLFIACHSVGKTLKCLIRHGQEEGGEVVIRWPKDRKDHTGVHAVKMWARISHLFFSVKLVEHQCMATWTARAHGGRHHSHPTASEKSSGRAMVMRPCTCGVHAPLH